MMSRQYKGLSIQDSSSSRVSLHIHGGATANTRVAGTRQKYDITGGTVQKCWKLTDLNFLGGSHVVLILFSVFWWCCLNLSFVGGLPTLWRGRLYVWYWLCL